MPERCPYLALQEHVKLVSAERVAASVVSGPVKNCIRLHARGPVYNKGKKSVEINALLTNTYVYMTNSATHTRPELAKTDGYAVKTKQRCLLCTNVVPWFGKFGKNGGTGKKSEFFAKCNIYAKVARSARTSARP